MVVAFATYYLLMTALEIGLGLSGRDNLTTPGGTLLFQYAQPHTGIHILMSIGLVLAALWPVRLGRPAFWGLAAILLGTTVLSMVNRQFAGEGLGHPAGMPLGYLIVNAVAGVAALAAAWATRPPRTGGPRA